jgi:DNA-binding NarL/FixJ family response regulator
MKSEMEGAITPPELDEAGPRRIRLLMVDDHPIVRDGLRQLFFTSEEIEVVGEGSNGREALELIQSLKPDIVLLDIRMPVMDGLGVLNALQTFAQRPRTIVLTGSEDKNEYVQAMKLGCSGIVLKQTATELILKSIRKVHAGEIWLDSHTTAAVMKQFALGGDVEPAAQNAGGPALGGKSRGRSPLSQREREIVGLVAQGFKNKEMAERCLSASRR